MLVIIFIFMVVNTVHQKYKDVLVQLFFFPFDVIKEGLSQLGKHLLLYHAFNRIQKAFSPSVDLDGVKRSAGMSWPSCNQAQRKRLIPLVMTPARQAQQFSSADTDR